MQLNYFQYITTYNFAKELIHRNLPRTDIAVRHYNIVCS